MSTPEDGPISISHVFLDGVAGIIYGMAASATSYAIAIALGVRDSEFPKILIWSPALIGGLAGLTYGVIAYRRQRK